MFVYITGAFRKKEDRQLTRAELLLRRALVKEDIEEIHDGAKLLKTVERALGGADNRYGQRNHKAVDTLYYSCLNRIQSANFIVGVVEDPQKVDVEFTIASERMVPSLAIVDEHLKEEDLPLIPFSLETVTLMNFSSGVDLEEKIRGFIEKHK